VAPEGGSLFIGLKGAMGPLGARIGSNMASKYHNKISYLPAQWTFEGAKGETFGRPFLALPASLFGTAIKLTLTSNGCAGEAAH